jgi:two-component system, OmpR family, sensor histidine kinase RstB
MKRLYQKIYLTIIATLLVVVIAAALMWRFGPGAKQETTAFEITRELVGLALPPATAAKELQTQGVLTLAKRLKIDLALYDENFAKLASTNPDLPKPDGETNRLNHKRGNLVWTFQLNDKRWIVAKAPQFRRRSALGMIGFLGGIALIIALCAYPVVRGLTRRLERLQVGVETLGTGDLATRVEVQGKDEVAQLAKSFNAAAAQIEDLFETHRQLLANASHELRTPLARIRLGIELMKTQATQERQDNLESDIQELDQMIDEILLASRLEAIHTLEAEEDIDLLALVAEECARYGSCWLHGEPSFVHGDPRLLRRLVRNLLDNASRHGKPPIEIEVMPKGDTITLKVCDHGPGIPQSESENVFKPFYRLAGNQNKAGSGLGLALVRQIAKRHGGNAVISPKEDNTSCICITLPAL